MNSNDVPLRSRSTTGRGRPAAVPEGDYAADLLVQDDVQDHLIVSFAGEDGRTARFSFATLPLPGMHQDLARAFACRVGPTGGLRTEASAIATWGALSRFVRFLAKLPRPPRDLPGLRASHLARFRLHRLSTNQDLGVMTEINTIRLLLAQVQPSSRLNTDVMDFLAQRGSLNGRFNGRKGGVPGYSEQELTAIMRAARSDAAAIRNRIRDGEALLVLAQAAPDKVSPADESVAQQLVTMARDGAVPKLLHPQLNGLPDWTACRQLAGRLFLLGDDIAPLLVLAVGLSGRNGETIKELPAEHRSLEHRAVAVNLVKRRRGKAKSRETVHWEIGGESRQLHEPGGFYLLLHELMARSREVSGSTRVWSVWVNELLEDSSPANRQANGHIDPFATRLSRAVHLGRWAARHGLTDDDGNPLRIDLNRIKTSVEVRRARATGGHMPSTARTNTMDVSFLHYLREDPRIRDWADRVLTDALTDAQAAARDAHLRVMDASTRTAFMRDPAGTAERLGTTSGKIVEGLDGELDTLVSSCLDHNHGPHNDGPCRASFLPCLRCPNALVLERHLPMLLSLLDYLQRDLDATNVDAWCQRHAITWLIITRLILPRFTEAQRAHAARAQPAQFSLDLLEGPKETRMTLAYRRVTASPVSADTFVLARRPLRPGTVLAATSRFADDIWHLSPALLQKHQQSSIINFADVPAALRHVAKELFLALLRFDLPPGERKLSIDTVRGYFSDVKTFLRWADRRGVTILRSVTTEDLAVYQKQLEQTRISPDTRGSKRRAVRLFWLFRTKLSDPVVLDPATAEGWDEQTINPGRGENATERIPEEVLAPLLTWASRWSDDFADDVLAAHTEWAVLYAQTLNNRQRRGEKGVGGIQSRLQAVLDRYRTEQRPLPLGAKRVNHTQLAREIGCDPGPLYGAACQRLIDKAAAELGIDDGTYLRAPITGKLDGRPWRGRIGYTDVELLGRLLQAACYIVIAYLSGMRDSEVKHLRRGCLSRRKDDTGRTYRRTVTSRAFKGERTPAGVTATWVVTEPVERAITVLEQLQPATEPFLFAVLRSSRGFLQARETGVKSTAASNLDIVAFVDWINAYSVEQNRPDQVPLVNGRRWRLTTRQFRRTPRGSSPDAPAESSPARSNIGTTASRCSRAMPEPPTRDSGRKCKPSRPSPAATSWSTSSSITAITS